MASPTGHAAQPFTEPRRCGDAEPGPTPSARRRWPVRSSPRSTFPTPPPGSWRSGRSASDWVTSLNPCSFPVTVNEGGTAHFKLFVDSSGRITGLIESTPRFVWTYTGPNGASLASSSPR